jgi:hypothetical protein
VPQWERKVRLMACWRPLWAEKEECYEMWMGGSGSASRASLRTAGMLLHGHLTLPNLGGLLGWSARSA